MVPAKLACKPKGASISNGPAVSNDELKRALALPLELPLALELALVLLDRAKLSLVDNAIATQVSFSIQYENFVRVENSLGK